MIVECKKCSRKFNLNEHLLKPTGSRVRCSKCKAVFQAYPIPSCSRPPAAESDSIAEGTNQCESSTYGNERRKHPRIPVSIPVLCDAIDLEGNSHDLLVGVIKEVSLSGLAIELFSTPVSEEVSLSFINLENEDVEIRAKVVHSRISAFKIRIGLSLTGLPLEINHFVTQVMTVHQAT